MLDDVNDRANTIAVLPLLETSRHRTSAAIWTSTVNLIHAIVQGAQPDEPIVTGSSVKRHGDDDDDDEDDDDEDDDGASSFVYAAPAALASDGSASAAPHHHQQQDGISVAWHISNRYYDADVQVRGLRPEEVASVVQCRKPRGLGSQRRPQAGTGDVFDALAQQRASVEVGPSSSTPMPSSGEDANDRLAQRLRGVPALVLVVDSSASLSTHKRILAGLSAVADPDRTTGDEDEEGAGISGFGLGVSLVVGLPTPRPLDVDADAGQASTSGPKDRGLAASRDDLVELYATDGWEYVDLGVDGTGSDSFSDDGTDSGSDGEEGQEAEGIERVREALMTHPWPGLMRKDEAQGRAMRRLDQEADGGATLFAPSTGLATGSFSDWRPRRDEEREADDDDNDGAGFEDGAGLRAPSDPSVAPRFPSLGLEEHATPDEVDEALARAFLARLEHGFSLHPVTGEGEGEGEGEGGAGADGKMDLPLPTNPRALEELEAFLESEDPAWPSSSSSFSASASAANDQSGSKTAAAAAAAGAVQPNPAGRRRTAQSGGTWGRSSIPPAPTGEQQEQQQQQQHEAVVATTFDDDFDDFVAAATPAAAPPRSSGTDVDGGRGVGQALSDSRFSDDFDDFDDFDDGALGLNAATRLDMGPLGFGGFDTNAMAAASDEEGTHDLSAQFRTLQMHAERMGGEEGGGGMHF
ncbi:uncharacterized protein PFL1_01751 [Pseudozyma flocculosa PF-1]|uniref:uncharacterized protein n=1 Tax=Pseudozyma flocculosa PF-1 TaxID=1277687 RepID=UPI0004561597|nr:uncharacterized protein PFL1_01751 [Pseudozyma flocculosa PF-1]EPQ30854.1 hypothetical protein PFL1_01751 [Pseudozyma flocculosa PF-1]